jgi:hypothetical protein
VVFVSMPLQSPAVVRPTFGKPRDSDDRTPSDTDRRSPRHDGRT